MKEWLDKLIGRNKETANVQYLNNVEWPVDKVFEKAVNAGLESVSIIGWTKDGERFWSCTSHPKSSQVLWDMEVMKKILLDRL